MSYQQTSRDDRAVGQLTEPGTAIDCRDGYAALPPSKAPGQHEGHHPDTP